MTESPATGLRLKDKEDKEMTTFPAKYYYEYTNRETGELLLS